jgi:hypothetical protein
VEDRNDLAYWFPRLQASGVPVPRTEIVRTDVDLMALLDGRMPEGYAGFINDLGAACARIGFPVFLRTGHGSGKHEWSRTCYLAARTCYLSAHVTALVEWSALAHIMGLPTTTWAAREFLHLRHHFTAFRGMPIAREFRAFVADGALQCLHGYWTAVAIRNASIPNWERRLEQQQRVDTYTTAALKPLIERAARQLDGAWSIDFAQRADGAWVAIDAAEAERSFHWPDCPHRPEAQRATAES